MMQNPVPNLDSSVPTDWFVGREDMLEEILSEASSEKVFFVSGIRGQGKTSLFDKLKDELLGDGTCVIALKLKEQASHGTVNDSHRNYKVVPLLWENIVRADCLVGQSRIIDRVQRVAGTESVKALLSVLAIKSLIAKGLLHLLPAFVRNIRDDADGFLRRLIPNLRPSITRVVILIDEADLELHQCRSLAKAVTELSDLPHRQPVHIILFCKPFNLSQLSNREFGPRSPCELRLLDFDEIEVEALVRKVTFATTESGDSDAEIASEVYRYTGGVPNVTMPFLYQLWDTWARRSKNRGISASDVRETAISLRGALRDSLVGIIKEVKQFDIANETNVRRLLHRISTEDSLDSPMEEREFRELLTSMTENTDDRENLVSTVISELSRANIISTSGGTVMFRGRLLRQMLQQ